MDPAATQAAIEAAVEAEPVIDDAPTFIDSELDRAREVADRLRVGVDVSTVDPHHLAPLSADAAARLVGDLVVAGNTDALVLVVTSTSPERYPLAALMRAAAALPRELYARAMLVRAVALSSAIRLRSALDEVNADPALREVIRQVANARTSLAGAPPYRWWQQPEMAMAEPPVHDDRDVDGEGGRGAAPDNGPDDEPEDTVFRGDDAKPGRKAYPRLDVVSGTTRPDVVVLDQPFEVTIGLQSRRSGGAVTTRGLWFSQGENVSLEAVLLYDPQSIEVAGNPRVVLAVTDLNPFPSVTLTCVARSGEVRLNDERRIGVQLLRDGKVVGLAWRSVVVAETADRVAEAVLEQTREDRLLDLAPLLGDDAPDLVLSVFRSDAGSEASFVWTAYAADPTVTVPDLPSTMPLPDDVKAFATDTRRYIEYATGEEALYVELEGRGVRIANAIPPGIEQVIRSVVEAPARTEAAAVLLLTEELSVPWEIAVLNKPHLASQWGGESRFFGAHAAISRWPLTEREPRPQPRPVVAVRTAAVLTADFTGVQGFEPLPHAQEEAGEVAHLFDPPAEEIAPELWPVMDLLRGKPARDLLHVALHGKFDVQSPVRDGLVLLQKSPAGGATEQFLTPNMLEGGDLQHGPFVFLNACQVAADRIVLGDYGGFASTLLRIGAGGVVAPLWNVRDDIAAACAREFYAATLAPSAGTNPVAAAEAVRRLRSRYTEAAVRAGQSDVSATLIAYQVFGHPRLKLTRG